MYYYNETDNTGFDFQELYASARKVVKKIMVKVGGVMMAVYISVSAAYAQEPVSVPQDNLLAVVELVSNIQETPATFDIADGMILRIDKMYNPVYQYEQLQQSLMCHKGDKMNTDSLAAFRSLASQLARLPFKESLVRYSSVNEFVSVILAFDKGVELEITQCKDNDDVAFSIHYEGEMMAVSTAPAKELTDRMLEMLNKTKGEANGLS